jgi:spermidine synthase
MPWKVRTIEDGAQRLVLREASGVVELVAGQLLLLSSAALETERAFGRLAANLGRRSSKRVIVGGLGFGATVRGVLDVVADDTRIVVVEKVRAVERLVRGELAYLAGSPLDDRRVTVVNEDVGDVLAREAGSTDAILLDVDNGPHWASFRTNARLYSRAGLLVASCALTSGGAFAVWSGYRADGFLGRLRGAGLAPSVVALRERGRVRARAYVGKKQGG